MKSTLTLILLMICISAAPVSAASPVKARILSGIGILLIRTESGKRPSTLFLFKEPRLGRIAELDAALLPPLSKSISPPDGFTPVIVTSKKTGWYRIVYDDGEREGWIEGQALQQFFKWEELLINREIMLLGGLKKEYYQLRKDPDFSSVSLAPVDKGSRVTSLRTDGDWIWVRTDSQSEGWLRWRDDNSRLVISINL